MPRRTRGPSAAQGRPLGDDDLPPKIGANLRRLRSKRGLSLERLAQRSGVSRAMLSQIERGHSTPTINVLWKIARALEVTFSALITERTAPATAVLPGRDGKVLSNRDGSFSSRALFPPDQPRRAEFYELRLMTGGEEQARPHPPGTSENLVVTAGAVDIGVGDAVHRLEAGDAVWFGADLPHFYRNAGAGEAVMYLVMTYADDIR